jgi:uncharacterized protein YvpB
VVLKAGSSELSARTAAAHTGALVGDDATIDAVFADLGVIRVDSIEDMLMTAGAAAALGRLSGGLGSVAHADTAGAAAAPDSAFLPADPQTETYRQKWALSCEYAATHTALRLLGFDVSEDTMRPLAGSGEDPDETFRGEIQANQDLSDYGIHAKGIAKLIERLKAAGHLPDRVETQLLYNLDAVRAAVAQGKPVVVWVPLDLRPSTRVPVRLSTGKVVNLVYAEHALTVRGYDGSRVLALDPHAGASVAYDLQTFQQAMSLFDDPALAIGLKPAVPAVPAVPTSEYFAQTGVTLDGGFYRLYRQLGGRDALGLPLNQEIYEPDAATGADKMVVYSEVARLEWYARIGGFGLGFVGQEYLGPAAAPDPNRRLGGAIARFVAANGGVARFGYSLSEEVPVAPGDDLLPPGIKGEAIGQWFQTGVLVWSKATGVVPGRAGLVLARQRSIVP